MKQALNTAFIDHYESYKDKIYSYLFYRLNMNRELAEDLTSDTFIKAYEKFETYDDDYAFSTWIYTVARNILTDYFRSQSNKKVVALEEGREDVYFESRDSVDTWQVSIDREASMDQVKAILKDLPDFQKDCIIMKYLDELSTKEISTITSQKEAAVRQALSRGIRRARTILKPIMNILILLTPSFL